MLIRLRPVRRLTPRRRPRMFLHRRRTHLPRGTSPLPVGGLAPPGLPPVGGGSRLPYRRSLVLRAVSYVHFWLHRKLWRLGRGARLWHWIPGTCPLSFLWLLAYFLAFFTMVACCFPFFGTFYFPFCLSSGVLGLVWLVARSLPAINSGCTAFTFGPSFRCCSPLFML